MEPPITVIHVDDDADILSITRMSLELFGDFEVKQFGSGKELLESLAGLRPDLFLLDVMMPEMSGLDLLEELRKRDEYKDTPTVFMTAKADLAFKDALIGLRAVDCITKPFDPITLPEQLKALLGK